MSHTPLLPLVFDEVKTSSGRCFRIGTADQLAAPPNSRPRQRPSYACLYDDYGHGDNETKAFAERIVRAVNAIPALIEALEQIVDEKCDYMRINHLGDPETQHTIKAARAVLSTAREQGRKDRT